jgi:hypothetical protein
MLLKSYSGNMNKESNLAHELDSCVDSSRLNPDVVENAFIICNFKYLTYHY